MAQKAKKEGMERFQGVGIDFKAKMIGIEKVDEARGDRMCQEAMGKLKAMVKAAGEHKQRVIISISIEGLKIIDEKTGSINHHHEVHKISFISRDPGDNRAFGYIYGEANNHQFFGIKTEKAAENVVLALKDLFQVVLELKTKQMEEQKLSSQQTVIHLKPSYDDPLYEVPIGQEQAATQENGVTETPAESPDDVNALYAVPNKSQTPEQGAGNLLDLAAEVKTLQLGINDMDQFNFDPVTEGSTKERKTPDSTGSKSPNPFQMSDSWSTDPFNSPQPLPPPAQNKTTTNFATAFGDPFVAPTSTSQSSSANLFAEFSDTFSSPTNAPAPSSTANPFGNNFNAAFGGAPATTSPFGAPAANTFGSTSPFSAPAANTFGSTSPFSAPANNAFAGAAFGTGTSNVFQTNFSNQSQAPAADPFADPFMIGGAPSASSTQGVIGQPLAPTAVPKPTDSVSKPDPFGDLNLINSSSSKSGKDMFANFQMAKPGEVAMPDITPAGMPDRPPPALPSADGNSDSIDSHEQDDVTEDFNLPPPQVPPPTLPPSFNAFEELDEPPPPPPPRPRYSSNTASVAIPARPAQTCSVRLRPDQSSSFDNLNSDHADKSSLSPAQDLFSKQQFSLPCNWTSDSLEKHFDSKNVEATSNSASNLDSTNLSDQDVFDPFNLHSNSSSTAARTIPSHCISNHPSTSQSVHLLNKPPLPNGTSMLSTSLPSSERAVVKMSSSKSTSSISSLQSKASLPIHEDPFADDPFATSQFTTSKSAHSSSMSSRASSMSSRIPSHSTTAVPPPLPSRPKSQSSVNNGKNPILGAATKKTGLTTSDGLALFDDSPFGL